jgi:hypothetical protein
MPQGFAGGRVSAARLLAFWIQTRSSEPLTA